MEPFMLGPGGRNIDMEGTPLNAADILLSLTQLPRDFQAAIKELWWDSRSKENRQVGTSRPNSFKTGTTWAACPKPCPEIEHQIRAMATGTMATAMD